jgi:broad specificity phosphatase PhoE
VKRLVVLRHGVTAWNQDGRFQGQADVALTPLGHEQAARAAAALARLEPSLLWSSDLSRARATAEQVAVATGLPVTLDERLREIHVGDLQGLTHAEVVERHGPGPWDYGTLGGESEDELAARVVGALKDAAAALEEDGTGILVCHGHAIRVALIGFLGWPLDMLPTLGALDNCGWVELADVPATWSAPAPWRLSAYNRTAPIS